MTGNKLFLRIVVPEDQIGYSYLLIQQYVVQRYADLQ